MNPVNKMELNHAVICELTNVMHILLCIYIYIYVVLIYCYIYTYIVLILGWDQTGQILHWLMGA